MNNSSNHVNILNELYLQIQSLCTENSTKTSKDDSTHSTAIIQLLNRVSDDEFYQIPEDLIISLLYKCFSVLYKETSDSFRLNLTDISNNQSILTITHCENTEFENIIQYFSKRPFTQHLFTILANFIFQIIIDNNSKSNNNNNNNNNNNINNSGNTTQNQFSAAARQQYYSFFFEYCIQHNLNLKSLFTIDNTQFIIFSQCLLSGLCDYWSAIRKSVNNHFTILLNTNCLDFIQIFDFTQRIVTHIQSSMTIDWQQQEGSILAIKTLLNYYSNHKSIMNSSQIIQISNLILPILHQFISHDQLTIREYVSKSFCFYLNLDSESETSIKTLNLFIEKLKNDKNSGKFLSDFESEGILSVCDLLLNKSNESILINEFHHYYPVFELYLGHPASTVRQQASQILANIANKSEKLTINILTACKNAWKHRTTTTFNNNNNNNNNNTGNDSISSSISAPISPSIKRGSLAKLAALFGDVKHSSTSTPNSTTHTENNHNNNNTSHSDYVYDPIESYLHNDDCVDSMEAAVYFSLPPNHSLPRKPKSPPAVSASISAITANILRQWEWKEGCMMTLELIFKQRKFNLSNNNNNNDNANSNALSPTLLYPLLNLVLLSCLSGRWELRRISDQVAIQLIPLLGCFSCKSLIQYIIIHIESNHIIDQYIGLLSMKFVLNYLYLGSNSIGSIPDAARSDNPELAQKLELQQQETSKTIRSNMLIDFTPYIQKIIIQIHTVTVKNNNLNTADLYNSDWIHSCLFISYEQFSTLSTLAIITAFSLFDLTHLNILAKNQLNNNNNNNNHNNNNNNNNDDEISSPTQFVLNHLNCIHNLAYPSTTTESNTNNNNNNDFLSPNALSMNAKLQSLLKQRAKKTESWLINSIHHFLPTFTNSIDNKYKIHFLPLFNQYYINQTESEIKMHLLRSKAHLLAPLINYYIQIKQLTPKQLTNIHSIQSLFHIDLNTVIIYSKSLLISLLKIVQALISVNSLIVFGIHHFHYCLRVLNQISVLNQENTEIHIQILQSIGNIITTALKTNLPNYGNNNNNNINENDNNSDEEEKVINETENTENNNVNEMLVEEDNWDDWDDPPAASPSPLPQGLQRSHTFTAPSLSSLQLGGSNNSNNNNNNNNNNTNNGVISHSTSLQLLPFADECLNFLNDFKQYHNKTYNTLNLSSQCKESFEWLELWNKQRAEVFGLDTNNEKRSLNDTTDSILLLPVIKELAESRSNSHNDSSPTTQNNNNNNTNSSNSPLSSNINKIFSNLQFTGNNSPNHHTTRLGLGLDPLIVNNPVSPSDSKRFILSTTAAITPTTDKLTGKPLF